MALKTTTTEILNTDEIARIVNSSPYEPSHGHLLAALNSRYPRTAFRLLADYDGCRWNAGIISASGNRVSDKLSQWIDQELAAAGGDASEVWRRHKDEGLIRTERVGSTLYLVAPYGDDPDAFYQLEILVGAEMTIQLAFDPSPYYSPEDRQDLLTGPCFVFGDDERQVLAPPQYQFTKLVNLRRFLRDLVAAERENRLAVLPEMERRTIHIHEIAPGPEGGQTSYDVPFLELFPDWINHQPPAYRLFLDWKESSAGGSGHRICDHWWMSTSDWKDPQGRRHLSLIPQWAPADGGLSLPVIEPGWEASPYGVMESLLQFDKQTGYPMSWFFYMLHGNRITHSAGGVISKAILEGLLHLPDHDEKVLLRWKGLSYSF